MEIIELTPEICFEIITQNHNKYFKSKEVVDEIIVQEYGIPYMDLKYNNDVSLTKLKHQINRKLSLVLHDLKENGKIVKYSKKFWIIKN